MKIDIVMIQFSVKLYYNIQYTVDKAANKRKKKYKLLFWLFLFITRIILK